MSDHYLQLPVSASWMYITVIVPDWRLYAVGIRKYCCTAPEGVTPLPATSLSKALIYVGLFFCLQLLLEGALVFVQSLLACLLA